MLRRTIRICYYSCDLVVASQHRRGTRTVGIGRKRFGFALTEGIAKLPGPLGTRIAPKSSSDPGGFMTASVRVASFFARSGRAACCDRANRFEDVAQANGGGGPEHRRLSPPVAIT